MRRHALDDVTADRLLTGQIEPDDAPPGYGKLATLVRRARAETYPVTPSRRDAAVSLMAEKIGASKSEQGEGKRVLGKLLPLKVLGIGVPAMALMAGTAAAATSSLPAPAQAFVHDALSKVGLVSSGNQTTPGSGHSSTGSTPVGPNASGPAKYGLCTAYQASAGNPSSSHSVAFTNLENAAANAGQTVTQYCSGVTPAGGTKSAGPNASGPAKYGLCTAYQASAGNPSSSHDVAFTNLENAAKAAGESISQYCTGVTPAGSSKSAGQDSSSSSNGHQSGKPASTPGSGHSQHSTPAGPPSSTPASGVSPVPTPHGPPSSTPASGVSR